MAKKLKKVKSFRSVLVGYADSVGKNKAGHFVVRRGFFYRMGMESEKFAEGVIKVLAAANFKAYLVDHGEVWKAFRGGASVAAGSHFWAEIAVEEN